MRISEIKIDDSQTGDYWVQITVGSQRDAFSMKSQILKDQAVRERLEKYVEKLSNSESDTDKTFLKKLQEILDYSE